MHVMFHANERQLIVHINESELRKLHKIAVDNNINTALTVESIDIKTGSSFFT